MCEAGRVSSATTPPPADGPNDSRTTSIAWAIATIVVALVAAFIAWLALGDRGGDEGAAGSQSSPAVTEAPPTAQTPTQGESAQQPAAPQGMPALPPQPPDDVAQLLIELQRRDADDPMAIGDVDAPVVMIEYADYRCPYCARFHLQSRPGLMPLVEDGTLRIEFRDLVIFDEPSQHAAVAARAAAQQDLLADYQHALFERSAQGRAELTRDDLLAIAEEVGVPDLEAFEAALDDEKLDAAVRIDTDEGRSLGITSTPTMLVNTAVVQGAQGPDYFKAVIAQELAEVEAGETPTPGASSDDTEATSAP